MKKLLALALSATLIFSLVACSQNDPAPTGSTTPSTQATIPTQPSTEVTEPSTEPSTPTTESTLPSEETTAPSEPSEEPSEPSSEPTEPLSKFNPELCADAFGVWYSVIRLDGSQLSLQDFSDIVTFNLIWVFGGTGTYTILPDPNRFPAALAEYEAALVEYMVEGRRMIYVSEKKLDGYSESKANRLWRENQEATDRTECAAAVQALNLAVRFSQLNASGEYYIENGRLHLVPTSGQACSMGFSSGEEGLTLTDCDNSRFYGALGIRFPLDLTPDPFVPPVEPAPTEPSEPSAEPSAPSEPSEPSEEPSEPSEEPSVPSEEPSVPSEEPSEPSEEPSEPSEEPSVPSEEPSEEPSVPSEEPSVPSEEPSVPSEEPSEPSEEPSVPSEEPSVPSEEPSEPSEEPSMPSEEPSEPSEEPSEEPVIE